jgi:hypothetical protein
LNIHLNNNGLPFLYSIFSTLIPKNQALVYSKEVTCVDVFLCCTALTNLIRELEIIKWLTAKNQLINTTDNGCATGYLLAWHLINPKSIVFQAG